MLHLRPLSPCSLRGLGLWLLWVQVKRCARMSAYSLVGCTDIHASLGEVIEQQGALLCKATVLSAQPYKPPRCFPAALGAAALTTPVKLALAVWGQSSTAAPDTVSALRCLCSQRQNRAPHR